MARSNLLDIGAISSILIYLAKGRDGGYASPSRYEVVITQPPKLPGNTDVLREINMETTQVSFPGMALEVQEDVNIYGPVRKIVTGQTFSEISTQIRLSADLKERNYIDSWQRMGANRQDFSVGYYDDYVGQMEIYQLDKRNRRTHGVRLLECYPQSVAEISLDYATNNSLSFVNVTWAYRYWINLTDESELPQSFIEEVEDLVGGFVKREIAGNLPPVIRRLKNNL